MNPQKTVLVTGTSSGFGKVMSETLARKGYQVFASMRNATAGTPRHATHCSS